MENLRPRDREDDRRDQRRRRRKVQLLKRYGTIIQKQIVCQYHLFSMQSFLKLSSDLKIILQTSGKGRGRPKKNPEPAASSDEKSGEEEQE